MLWKPTAAECKAIKEAAARSAVPRVSVAAVLLEPGIRHNIDSDRGTSINIALVSDDPEFNDTDLHDHGSWAEFRRGVPLNAQGKAVVDFYTRRRNDEWGDLLGNVTVWYEAGKGIVRMETYG